MLFKSLLTGMLVMCSLTSGFAQPRLSLGITGGLQIYPSRVRILPLIGGSAWYRGNQSFFVSSEYVRYRGVDLYPLRSGELYVTRVHENSHTQRLVLGLHHVVKTYNASSVALLGINVGQSWDMRGYQLYEDNVDGTFRFVANAKDRLHRSVLFASLTALSQGKKFPFYLQSRFGMSFNDFSSFAFTQKREFFQVLAGVHWGVW